MGQKFHWFFNMHPLTCIYFFVSSTMGRTAAKRTASSGEGSTVTKKAKVVATRKPKSPPTRVKKHTAAGCTPASTLSDAVSKPTDEATPPKTTDNSIQGQDTATQSEAEPTAQQVSANSGAEAVSNPPETSEKTKQGHEPATHDNADS